MSVLKLNNYSIHTLEHTRLIQDFFPIWSKTIKAINLFDSFDMMERLCFSGPSLQSNILTYKTLDQRRLSNTNLTVDHVKAYTSDKQVMHGLLCLFKHSPARCQQNLRKKLNMESHSFFAKLSCPAGRGDVGVSHRIFSSFGAGDVCRDRTTGGEEYGKGQSVKT